MSTIDLQNEPDSPANDSEVCQQLTPLVPQSRVTLSGLIALSSVILFSVGCRTAPDAVPVLVGRAPIFGYVN